MAGFEGTIWAQFQGLYTIKDKTLTMRPMEDRVPAVSRSIHYGLCLAFEGIRYFVARDEDGLAIRFLNLHCNLSRFRRSIAFNFGSNQQPMVPTESELETLLLDFLRSPEMRPFIEAMAASGGQGYLRPFTVDEAQSIGVTFPDSPSIRIVTCTYDRYMGEPFSGVVVPDLVRAVGVNGTGCLKLGVNYLLSVKAVDKARTVQPGASSALFLDDRPDLPLWERTITEWDSSCCLIALTDNSVIRIPDGPLILPSVTIRGICAVLQEKGVRIDERDITYGELRSLVRAGRIAAIASIGTAGILNRAASLTLVDEQGLVCGEHHAQQDHPMYALLGEARNTYWDMYRGQSPVAEGLQMQSFPI